MMNFLKNIFGGNTENEVEELPINDTQHSDPKFDNMPGQLFKKDMKANPNAVLLDVRTAMEVGAGAIPGAVNIDFMSNSFSKKVAALDKTKTYYLYCRSGNRSGQACQLMHKMGFDVRNLMGGIGEYPK